MSSLKYGRCLDADQAFSASGSFAACFMVVISVGKAQGKKSVILRVYKDTQLSREQYH